MADDAALPPLPYDLDEWERRCHTPFVTCHSTAGTLALIAHVRALQAENERLREVAQALLKAANEVATYGATTGGQWTRLSSAIIQARAALAASRREG